MHILNAGYMRTGEAIFAFDGARVLSISIEGEWHARTNGCMKRDAGCVRTGEAISLLLVHA